MTPSNDILGRRNKIKDCIASAQMEQALKRLIDFIRDFCDTMEDEAILLSMEYYDLDKEIRMDLLPPNDVKLARRKLAFKILETLNAAMRNYG